MVPISLGKYLPEPGYQGQSERLAFYQDVSCTDELSMIDALLRNSFGRIAGATPTGGAVSC